MLIGQKVILEDIDPANKEQLRLWRNDASMRRFFREYKYITKDMQDKWYASRGNNTSNEHVYFQIMQIPDVMPDMKPETSDLSRRKIIGCSGLHYINWRIRSAEFGIFLGDGRGGGRGKEALMLLCDYGFKEMNLHKIWAEVYNTNNAIHMYHKIGFKDEGILRDNQFCEGKYINSTVMSVLEDEWKELHGEKPLWKIEEL